MLMAWVEIAPQGQVQPDCKPEMMLLTERGRLAFPKS
jgi:hypothetical protein